MDGVLLVDKPRDVSSHRVVSMLRKALNTKKVGHAGTLDPAATGLLICCVGKATKISQYLMDQDKIYQTKVILGATSTTYDDEGEITQSNQAIPSIDTIKQVLQSFVGEISQVPPIYSAIKKDGKKLYQYARAGQDVEIEPRCIQISSIDLIEQQDNVLVIKVHCQKGTYIRSLAHDIGQALGCGAYAQDIRRLGSGAYTIDQCMQIQTDGSIDQAETSSTMINIFDALSPSFSLIQIDEAQAKWIAQGRPMSEFDALVSGTGMCLFHLKDQTPIAIADMQDQKFDLKRVF